MVFFTEMVFPAIVSDYPDLTENVDIFMRNIFHVFCMSLRNKGVFTQ